MHELIHGELTAAVLDAYCHVYNTLGHGFLEKVYENALILSLKRRGLYPARQVPIKVFFDEEMVGDNFADIIINDAVILEIKAAGIQKRDLHKRSEVIDQSVSCPFRSSFSVSHISA